jgi:hypothetical protein
VLPGKNTSRYITVGLCQIHQYKTLFSFPLAGSTQSFFPAVIKRRSFAHTYSYALVPWLKDELSLLQQPCSSSLHCTIRAEAPKAPRRCDGPGKVNKCSLEVGGESPRSLD